MDDILALQRELAAVQLEGVLNKLSDGNTIEIVDKLQALGLIEKGLIYTVSGKEYLTRQQLLEEIEDQILTRGGRVNVIDLPDSLEVDLHHVESALPDVIARSQGALKVVRGEVLADYYLDSLAQEINDSLNSSSEAGILYLPDIATKFNLPMPLVQSLLSAHIGSTIVGRLDRLPDGRSALFADSFVRRTRARAFSTLVACAANPVGLHDVAGEADIHYNIFMDVARAQIQPSSAPSKEVSTIHGTLIARGSEFVPELFETARQSFLSDNFRRDGYLNYAQLTELQIPEPLSKFLTANFSTGFAAGDKPSQVWIAPRFPEEVRSAAVEALETNPEDGGDAPHSWLDVAGMLPPQWPSKVVEAVVARAFGKSDQTSRTKTAGKKKRTTSSTDGGSTELCIDGGKVVASRFVVSDAFWKRILSVFQKHAAKEAETLAKEKAAASATVVSSSKPKQKIASKSTESKGKKGRRAAKSAEIAANVQPASSSLEPPSREDALSLLRNELPSELWESDHLGTFESDEMLLECLLDVLLPDLGETYLEAEKTALVEYERIQRQEEDAFYKSVATEVLRLEYTRQCLEMASQTSLDSSTHRSCIDHALRTSGIALVRKITLRTARQAGTELSIEMTDTTAWTPATVATVTKGLPAVLQVPCRLLDTATRGKTATVDSLLESYDATQNQLDLPERRPLDKKQQKNLHQEALSSLQRDILATNALTSSEEAAIDVLHKGITLTSGRLRPGIPLDFPTSVLPLVWEWVQTRLETSSNATENDGALVSALDNLRREVVELLRKKESTQDFNAGVGDVTLASCTNAVREAVAALN